MNLNSVILAGNLTKDPELRNTQSGHAVVSFSIASNRQWFDKGSNQKKEEVSYVDCEAWGKTAELVAQFLKKGRGCIVQGRLKQDRWQTNDGQPRSRLKVVADNVQFLGKGPGGQEEQAPATDSQVEEDVPF